MTRSVVAVLSVFAMVMADGRMRHAESDESDVDTRVLLAQMVRGDAADRRGAATALGEAGLEGAAGVPVLIEALHDDDRGVRKAASASLQQLGLLSAKPILDALEGDGSARDSAVKFLVDASSIGAIVGPPDIAEAAQRLPCGALLFLLVGSVDSPVDPYVWRVLDALCAHPRTAIGREAPARRLALAVAASLGLRARRIGTLAPQTSDEACLVPWDRVNGFFEHRLGPIRVITMTLLLDHGWSSDAAVEALASRVDDPLAGSMAASALGEIGPAARRAVPILRGRDEFIALRALVRMGDAEHVRTLLLAEDPSIRTYAALALAGEGDVDDTVVAVLQDALQPYGAVPVDWLMSVLGDCGPSVKEVGPGLHRLLQARDPRIGLNAASAILRLGIDDEEAYGLLEKALASRDRTDRSTALRAAQKIASPRLVPSLVAMLRDQELSHGTRCMVVRALLAIGAEASPAVALLIRNLRDAVDYLRRSERGDALDRLVRDRLEYAGSACVAVLALRLLAVIGPAASDAIPILKEIVKDEDYVLAYLASRAMRAIRPQ